MKRHTFKAEIKAGRGGGAHAEVPFDVEREFGAKQPQVKAAIDGEVLITRLVRMGRHCHVIGVPKALRVKLDKSIGATIAITVEPDATPRPEIVVPPDLDSALRGETAARAFFTALSYTHRKEYVLWITGAKKAATRATRVGKTVVMLKAGQKGV